MKKYHYNFFSSTFLVVFILIFWTLTYNIKNLEDQSGWNLGIVYDSLNKASAPMTLLLLYISKKHISIHPNVENQAHTDSRLKMSLIGSVVMVEIHVIFGTVY